MSSPNAPEGQSMPSDSSTRPAVSTAPVVTGTAQDSLIKLSALVVLGSFFLPWVQILTVNITGMDLQKETDSYRLVWLMPGLAGVTLALGLLGQKINLIRRLAGLCPFVILVYALNQMGQELFKVIAIGGWLALVGGAALIFIPSEPKSEPNT